MKNKIFLIFSIFIILYVFLVLLFYIKQPSKYRVLDVIEADEFYIDFNKNNKIDSDEHVKLKNIIAFKPFYSKYVKNVALNLGILPSEYLLNGFLAKNYAYNELKNHEAFVKGYKNKHNNQIYPVEIFVDGKNYEQSLLLKGLAYINSHTSNKNFFHFFNLNQVKKNASALSKLDFVLVNDKYKRIYNFDYNSTNLAFYTELNLKNNISLNDYKYVKNKSHSETIYSIPKSKNKYLKSVYFKDKDIELYLINPLEYSSPSYYPRTLFAKRLIKQIDNAKHSIDIAIYGINSQKDILNALKRAKSRGVNIRIVADSDKFGNNIYSDTIGLSKDFNVVTDKTQNLMHNKFLIFDNEIVCTGSTNLSSSGSGGYNSNIAVFIKDSYTVKRYIDEFNQLYSNKFSKNKIANNISLNSNNIKVYFSPQDDLREVILSEIRKAKKTIYISMFYLTDRKIINELIIARKRNVKILVLIDAVSSMRFYDRLDLLKNANIYVITENWGGKNHEKTTVIDNQTILIGSANYSKSAFMKNDENLLIINNEKVANLYSDYFLFLFNSIDKKYLDVIPKAESHESINSCNDGIDNDFDNKIDSEDEGCSILK